MKGYKVIAIDADDSDAIWLILKQIEEIITFPKRWRLKRANELADIIFIASQGIKKLGLDPLKVMDKRLEKRYRGQFKQIIKKYQKIREEEGGMTD